MRKLYLAISVHSADVDMEPSFLLSLASRSMAVFIFLGTPLVSKACTRASGSAETPLSSSDRIPESFRT